MTGLTDAGRFVRDRRRLVIGGLLLLPLLVIGLAGCAAQSVQPATSIGAHSDGIFAVRQPYWWYVRFRLRWPEDEDPPWYPDLFIADRVVGPVLDTNRDGSRCGAFIAALHETVRDVSSALSSTRLQRPPGRSTPGSQPTLSSRNGNDEG